MGRSKETYKYRIDYGMCGTCGRPAKTKAAGTYYSICEVCYERSQRSIERKAKGKKGCEAKQHQTLCWSCDNAVPYEGKGCSWSRALKPVEGWTAKKNGNSYYVKKCPLYIKSKKRKEKDDAENNAEEEI